MTWLRAFLALLLQPPRPLIDQPTLAELRVVLTQDLDGEHTRVSFTEMLPLPPKTREVAALWCLDEALNLFQREHKIDRKQLLRDLTKMTRGG